MSASQAVHAARAAGVELVLDGDDLVLKASSPPPAEVLDLLLPHKAEILPLLRPGRDGWSSDDWKIFFDERAGIAEFDGGLPRAEAEGRAFACCVIEWLNRNPAASKSGHCLACGGGDHPHDPLLPHGTDATGHAWLHSGCWPAWYAEQKAEAVAVLAAMGIEERKPIREQ